jgi:hypothetical protein
MLLYSGPPWTQPSGGSEGAVDNAPKSGNIGPRKDEDLVRYYYITSRAWSCHQHCVSSII